DSDALRPDARQTLSTLARRLDDDREIVVTVTGHADRSGSNEYNQALSSRRAAAVTATITDLGLRPADLQNLDVDAKGESDPAVATADGVREQANRRVVVEAYAREPVASAPTASAN
ncbi:MAG: OmpA family protein, partial [Alphaproteobacteria bacterium]